MSTHNICFHVEIRKILRGHSLLSGAFKVPYQTIWLRWLMWVFTVPIDTEDPFSHGVAYLYKIHFQLKSFRQPWWFSWMRL